MVETIEVRVPSKSRKGEFQTVTINHDVQKKWTLNTYSCSCPAITYGRTTRCAHIDQVIEAFILVVLFDEGGLAKAYDSVKLERRIGSRPH